MHRDLKPGNILIKGDCIKLADFGLAKALNNSHDRYSFSVVTLHYRAKEVLMNHNYGLGVDIWALGCILYELDNKKILLPGRNELDQLRLISELEVDGLVKLMLADQEERLNIGQVLELV